MSEIEFNLRSKLISSSMSKCIYADDRCWGVTEMIGMKTVTLRSYINLFHNLVHYLLQF